MLRRALARRTAAAASAAGAAGAGLAVVLLLLDDRLQAGPSVPSANARVLLGAAFGSLVTVGAFSFWMRPLAAQMAASNVPPRTLTGRLHDNVQRAVVASTVGALTYVAVVLYALPPGDAEAPTAATLVGAVVAVTAIVALLVAMERAERSTRPGRLLAETARAVTDDLQALGTDDLATVDDVDLPERAGSVVLAAASGWVQDVDERGLASAVPDGTVVRVDAPLGAFVVAGWSSLLTVWLPDGSGPAPVGDLARHVAVGEERGERLDLPGALGQLADVAVHAVAGGSGSPSIVYEALWHLGAVLHEVVRCELPPRAVRGTGETVVVLGDRFDHGDLVEAVVSRVRRVTADEPETALELVRVLRDVRGEAVEVGRADVVAALDRQLDLTVAQCRHGGALDADVRRVEQARAGGTPRPSLPDEGYQDERPGRVRRGATRSGRRGERPVRR